jgi:hypothetical protein
MSSLLTTPGQTPARVKFLRVVDTVEARFTIDSGKSVTALMSVTDFNDATTTGVTSDPSGVVLKDMGKEVVVYNATSLMHVAIYRLVCTVTGSNNEGDENDTYYVKVWDEAGLGVNVARVG